MRFRFGQAGKLRLRGAGGQEGRNQRFLPSCQSPLFPDAQAGGRNGCAVPISDQDRSEKYGGCCGSSVRAEVRARQRENGCRLSETVYARVTARAGGGKPPPPHPPGVEAVAFTVIQQMGGRRNARPTLRAERALICGSKCRKPALRKRSSSAAAKKGKQGIQKGRKTHTGCPPLLPPRRAAHRPRCRGDISKPVIPPAGKSPGLPAYPAAHSF